MDDAEMMQALQQVRQQGNRVALNALLEGIRPEVVAWVRDRVDSHPSPEAVAEELTQQTLQRVASSIGTCRAQTPAQFRSWVRTIARNLVTDRHRRREEEWERRDWSPGPQFDPDARRRDSSAWDQGEPSEADRALGKALLKAQQCLSEGTRQALWRRLMLEETWHEVGRAVGTTRGGAKRRWQRAVPRMKREILKQVVRLPPDLRRQVLRRLGVIKEDG